MNTIKKVSLFLFGLFILSFSQKNEAKIELPKSVLTLKERIEKSVKTNLQDAAIHDELYTIKKLSASPTFKQASFTERKKLALGHFIKRKDFIIKQSLSPYIFNKGAITTGLVLLVISIFYFMDTLKVYIRKLFKLPPSVSIRGRIFNPGDLLFNMVFPLIITPILGFLFSSANNLISLIVFYHSPHKLYTKIAPIEEKYISLKSILPKEYIDRIESAFINLRIDPKRQKLIKMITELLDLVPVPGQSKKLLSWDEQWANKVFEGFKPHIKEQLKEIAFQIMLRINLFISTGKRDPYPILLYGPPGTGKSYAARCLVKAIRASFFEMDLGFSHEALFGIQNERSGILTQALKNRNEIVILNDVDRSINESKVAKSWQLDFLDPSKQYFHDNFFDLDFNKFLVIIATTNYELGPAINNRFVSKVDFSAPFTSENIDRILERYMKKLIKTYSSLPYSVTREDFTDKEWANLRKEAMKEAERDQDEGIRTAQHFVEAYFIKKIRAKYNHSSQKTS